VSIVLSAVLAALALRGPERQTSFEFHCGFWLNLHHCLYNYAYYRKQGRALKMPALDEREGKGWEKALQYYERRYAELPLLDRTMVQIKDPLALAGTAPALRGVKIPAELAGVLENAAPIYRSHWWPEQSRKDHELIDRVSPLVAAYEAAFRPRLSHAFDTPWPGRRIRTEVVYSTPGMSAYTTVLPSMITISSWSQRNEGTGGLECLFHEASHTLAHKLAGELDAEVKRKSGALAFPDLWHAMIFYTIADVMHDELPGHIPYGVKYKMWEQAWPGLTSVLDADWRPFLHGSGGFKIAVDRVVDDVLIMKKAGRVARQ